MMTLDGRIPGFSAQFTSLDFAEGARNSFAEQFGPYAIYVAAAGVLLFAIIVFRLLYSRMKTKGNSDPLLGMTMPDVDKLKNKGLLTEEETKRVRQALARQVQKRYQTTVAPLSADALLLDPDVRRLEEQAQSKAAAAGARPTESPAAMPAAAAAATPQAAVSAAPPPPPTGAPTSATADLLTPRSVDDIFYSAPPPSTPKSQTAPPSTPMSPTQPEDDVPLPPDVLSMAQLGLITPEELEKIKERARAKRRQLGAK